MIKGALFDLGGTLAEYFPRFTPALRECMAESHEYLTGAALCSVSLDDVWTRVESENHEARNHCVRPLGKRLQRIFGVTPLPEQVDGMCRAFMRPIFALGRCYDDVPAVLSELRSMGLKTAIVSNAPWGSPATLWHEEIRRLGMHELVDEVVMCTDVGWRKPAKPVFVHAMEKLGLSAHDCIFVGDDPRWDLVGPRSVGMEAVVISREGRRPDINAAQIASLSELLPILKARA